MIRVTRFMAGLGALAFLAACGGDKGGNQGGTSSAATPSGGVDLNGAGASFPYPIYRKWFADYAAKTGVKINYQSIGSGGGVRQLQEGTVDFGGSDSPMSDDDIAKAKGGPIMHIPTVLGAVVLTYNLPGVTQPLKLTGSTISDIYLGKITKWNDPRIATLNAGVNLPNSDILPVYRSDGSGTTYVFSDYLSVVSPQWKAGPGRGKELKWPAGIGARGNESVAGQVKQTSGAIGYVELAYAKQNNLAFAHVQNASGQFVEPNVQSIAAAAQGASAQLTPASDYRVSVVNAAGAGSYPISSYTWILAYYNQTDAAKAQKLRDFLKWALTEGEQTARELDYAPVPPALAQRLMTRVDSIKVGT